MRRFLIIFMGLFILIGGVFCLFAPQTTYMQTGYVIGVLMLFHAVGNIVAWFDAKKYDEISGWYLVGAIISFIFAILILSTPLMQGAINVVILYMVIAWFIVMGSMGIVFAFKLKELKNKLPDVFKGSKDSIPAGKIEADIYPQGSFALGTVVKPWISGEEQEYDIDLVFQLDLEIGTKQPSALKNAVGQRLKRHLLAVLFCNRDVGMYHLCC